MVADSEAQVAGDIARQILDGLPCFGHFTEDALGTGQQFLACFGQINGA